MTNIAEQQIGALALLRLPRGSSVHWDPTTAKIGLQQLRRLRGEIAALEAVLVGVVKTEMGHDTKAALARGFGMSNAEARKAEEVADIVGRVPGAGDALVTSPPLRASKSKPPSMRRATQRGELRTLNEPKRSARTTTNPANNGSPMRSWQ